MDENKLTNFIHIPINKFYKEVEDMLYDEDYSFYNINDWNKINYNIDQILKKNNFTTSDLYNNNDLLDNMIIKIRKHEVIEGNTILLYADDDNMYEFVYINDYSNRENLHTYDDTNELGSISNINLDIVYGDGCIVKINYSDGILKNDVINNDDLIKIIYNNFYHIGVLISPNNEIIEITYTSDIPNKIIGDGFIKYKTIDVLGLTLLLYVEKTDEENRIIKKITNEMINGRVFITLLCPKTNKRIWNITKETIQNIIKIIDDNKKFENTINELEKDEKINNPFFFIKKNCL